MTRREFDEIVRDAVEGLPPAVRAKLENVQIAVRESPTRRQTAEFGGGLYGLYEGVSLDKRPHDFQGHLPDRITLFKRPIERDGRGREAMIRCIRETLVHEVGHLLGFDDDALDQLGIG